MGAACGCCRPNDEDGPKDDDDRHDREPLLQRDGSHGSIEDVRPADQLNEQSAIPIEQQHIDHVTNHPLSSQSPSKAHLYVQKRSPSPNKGDGLGFENPHATDSESQDPLGAADRQSTTVSPTDIKPEVLPQVIETRVLLHNQGPPGGPLVSPLIPQSNDDLLADPILGGSREIQGNQGDPRFSEWVGAEDDTISEISALNKDRSNVLLDLQNASTSPAGFGLSSSPHVFNPASPIGPNAAIPLIQATVSETNTGNTPTIDWSGNILPTQQAWTHGQLGGDSEYEPLTSARPGPAHVSQPPVTRNPEPVAAVGDSAGGHIDSSVTDRKIDPTPNQANSSVLSMDEKSLKTIRQENLSKLLEKEITLIGAHDLATVAANDPNQVTRDPVPISGGAVGVRVDAGVHQPERILSLETEASIGLNDSKEQAVSSQGHRPPIDSLNLDNKAKRSDSTPVVLDNTQTPAMPEETVGGAVSICQTVTAEVSRAAGVAADVENEDIPVDSKNRNNNKKTKGKKANDKDGSSKDDTTGQGNVDSSVDLLACNVSGNAAGGKGKQEPDSSVADRIHGSLGGSDKQGTDKKEPPTKEALNGDGVSSHVPTLVTDTISGELRSLINLDLGLEKVDAVKKSTGSTNVSNGDVAKGATKRDSEPGVDSEHPAVAMKKTEEVISEKQSGNKESVDANANIQRLEFEETGLPELDEKYKLETHLFNEYFDKFNLLQTDYKQMLTAYERTGLKCASLLPVFIMLKSQLGEDAKSSLKLERTNCYQIVFEPGHISEEDAAVFRYFNSSNRLLTDLITEEMNSVIQCAKMIIDSEEVTKNMVAERVPGPEQETIKLAVSKVVVTMRNVIPNVNYMIIEATRVQNDLEGAALVLFTQEDEKERVETHLTTKRSFVKL